MFNNAEPAHSSLAGGGGGCVTQILNLDFWPLSVGSLPKLENLMKYVAPILNPVALILVVPQNREVKLTQAPPYNCNTGLVILVPSWDIVIVWVEFTAEKENQTS